MQEQFEPILREANDFQETIAAGSSNDAGTGLGFPAVTVSEM